MSHDEDEMAQPKSVQKLSFEEAMQEMQAIVETMRKGELTLEESVKAYQRGKELSARCQELLSEAAEVVRQLEDGTEVPLREMELRQKGITDGL